MDKNGQVNIAKRAKVIDFAMGYEVKTSRRETHKLTATYEGPEDFLRGKG
jgi:hypothetical protein